jgi:predicted Zn-dependent protease
VHIIKNPAPNAFMMANGSCYVQLGLLALLDNEAELGTVLGHEGGHFVRQHGLQEHEHVENTAMLAVPLFGPALAASSMYGYSRDMEAEADSIGFQRMQTAGYDVHQAVVPFQRLDAYSQALDIKQPYFYADHPKLAERIQNFSAQIAQTTQQGGYVGEEEYLAAVHAARLWVLQEDLNRQDYKSLIFLLEDGRELAKYPAEARYYLGSAYLLRSKEGDAQKAEDEFRTCAGQAQDFPPVYAALGRLLMNQHKDAEALTDFQRYLQLSPEAADAAYVRMYIRRLSPAQADRGKS